MIRKLPEEIAAQGGPVQFCPFNIAVGPVIYDAHMPPTAPPQEYAPPTTPPAEPLNPRLSASKDITP